MVTGAGRGLGLATAQGLARDGFAVLMAVRDPARAEEALARVREACSGTKQAEQTEQTELVELDVARDDAGDRALSQILARGGKLEVLVNNAGVALGELDEEVARRTLAVNVGGPQRVTEALAPKMSAGGRIVMVSSGMGELSCLGPPLRERFAAPDLTVDELQDLLASFVADVVERRHVGQGWPSSAYRVSKAALGALTRIYARQFPHLRVNAVCPGWVRTAMGGASASRTIPEGAQSILWATRVPPDGPTGGFFRDGRRIAW